VLLVDDDDTVVETLSAVLKDDGYTVLVAICGDHAWTMLQVHAPLPDVVLLDLVMPNGDGWSVVDRLKSDPRLARIPLVVMSGHGRDLFPTVPEAEAHLPKPFDPGRLLETMRTVLTRRGHPRTIRPAPAAAPGEP
jgi:CheY-like chemotaxis protein